MAANDRNRTWQWRVLGESVCGASHLRHGMWNQDAIRWLPEEGEGNSMILSVSDGHGSAKSFRSARGARFGVTIATEELHHLLTEFSEDLTVVKRATEDHLPRVLTREWEQTVLADLLWKPFTVEERERLIASSGEKAWNDVEANPLLAYGATLLVIVATQTYLMFLQLGDGDIVVVPEDGEAYRPLAPDRRLIGGETTSLCRKNAWTDYSVGFQAIADIPPALVLASTDGYSNSFRDDDGFLHVGMDIHEMIQEEGLTAVQNSMNTWLSEASHFGSGDDITLGILVRTAPTRPSFLPKWLPFNRRE